MTSVEDLFSELLDTGVLPKENTFLVWKICLSKKCTSSTFGAVKWYNLANHFDILTLVSFDMLTPPYCTVGP